MNCGSEVWSYVIRKSAHAVCEFVIVFFCQAEDGIRDRLVTGVQTCALPIYSFLRFLKNVQIISIPATTFGALFFTNSILSELVFGLLSK